MTTHIDAGSTRRATADYDREFLEPEIETAPREEIERLQLERILELVPYVWKRSAFYRETWSAAGVDPDRIRTIDDFTRMIPTMTKDDVIAYRERTGDPFGGLLCVDPSELSSITSTSGTTSLPEPVAEIWSVVPPIQAISARDLWGAGLRPGDKVIVPTGTMRNYWHDFYQLLGLVPVFIDTWIGEGEKVLQAIHRHQIAYVQLMLPTIMEFERLEATYNIAEMVSSLKAVSFAGQPLGKALAAKVRNEWGINLYTYTSAGDTGTAWEGKDHDGFYLWEDTVFAESLDPVTGAPVDDRELGELVASDIDNKAAPYIRFRSGDLVRMTREPSSIGRTHARIWVAGRAGDELVIAGKALMVSDVWSLVESLPECSDGIFQVVRFAKDMDRMRIRVGYEPDRTADRDDLLRRVNGTLGNGLGVPLDIELVTCDELLSRSTSVAKFARVVNK